MSEYYILIFIILIILIIFYGGQNKLDKIKYNSAFFDYTINLNLLKEKLIFYNKTLTSDYLDITKNLNTCNYLFPNIIFSYCIKINPNSIFDINYLINNDIYKENYKLLMNIYTINDDYKFLHIIIDKINNESILVNIDENIFITNTYNIYNESNKNIIIIIFFTKKPLWYT
jgi:hypothetical protein